ncbi:hypothetical protein GQ44DRAFT_733667 [Phaeosphaeriaceae sp. PMI808]|nr:hypothetical protein GQ44DRAFT_733667 [Phaeosphaeriaceae sp. PMI808]
MLGDFEEGQQVYALDVSPKETSMYTCVCSYSSFVCTHRPSYGHTSAQLWSHIGPAMVTHRPSYGHTSAQLWSHIGPAMVQKVRRSLAGAVWRSYYTKARASRVTRSPLQKPHMKAKGFGSSMTRISISARSKYAAMLIGYRLRAVSDAMAQAQAEHRVRPARPVDASK